MNVLEKLSAQYAIPVIRETDEERLYSLAHSLAEGGLKVLEVTLMSEAALKVIKRLAADKDLTIGAGTVLNEEMVKKAIDAGAKFLVSPGLNEDAVAFASANKVPFIPGVMTPTEIMKAMALNCEVIKIFPVSVLGGIAYLKNLKGPFPHLKVMASGGIGLDDIREYFENDTFCVGTGSQLTPKESVKNEDWKKIRELAKEYIFEVNRLRR
ncbi:MAG: bifunctional 4-hydroxy-2-oxoglutarate aldolase/2-dehydro-3-deoxy-phosphogluconate aldolase [Bdellovibrionota bacterium]